MRASGSVTARVAGGLLLAASIAVQAAEMFAVEGEALIAKAKASAGNIASQPMSRFGKGWSGDAHLLWTGGAAGAVLDLAVDVPAPGLYAVEIYFTRAPDYAQVAIEVDGKSSPATFSGYAPRVAPPAPMQAGKFPLQAGARKLSLKITGKVAQSTGYLVGLDQVKFYPAGDLAPQAQAPRAPAPAAGSGVPLAQPAPAQRAAGSQSSPAPKQAGPECDSTCTGNVSSVFRRTETGQCKLWFRVPCHPYDCESASGVCGQTCASDANCAQGSFCDTTTGLCAPMSTACIDAATVRSANRQTQSCIPYKCVTGACKSHCDSPNDCTPGYSCELSSGRCVKKLQKP
jgi:hypothetical protein